MNFEFAGIIAFLALQFGSGVYLSLRILSESDYFLSGRNLGMVLATASIAATWFGAETCLNSSGWSSPMDFRVAVPTRSDTRSAFCSWGCWWRRSCGRPIPNAWRPLYRRRFGSTVERLAVLLMIPTSLLWAAAQIRAFGQVLAVSSGTEATVGMAIAAGVVILYSTVGGLRADVLTDLVQGIGIVVGLDALTLVTVSHFGGFDATPPAAGVYLVVGMIPICLALAGHSLVPGLEDHEQFLPTFARN